MDYQKFVEAICKVAELDKDTILASHGCSIRFRDAFDVHIEWDEPNEAFCLYANLIKAPALGNTEFYRYLLNTHLFGAATHGATFGYDHQNHAIMLFRNVAAKNLTEMSLLTMLETFVQQVEFWSKALQGTAGNS